MNTPPPRLLAICTGSVSSLMIRSHEHAKEIRSVMSGIRKSPVSQLDSPLEIQCTPMGLEGDEQADLSVHGGLDKAVYCYPFEHYQFWKTALPWVKEQPSLYGLVGENLCTSGLNETELYVGDQLRIGQAVLLRITKPREPCYKFNARMRSAQAAKLMAQEGLCGWYARVLQAGKIKAGDMITIVPGPRDITVAAEYQRLIKR